MNDTSDLISRSALLAEMEKVSEEIPDIFFSLVWDRAIRYVKKAPSVEVKS